MEQPPHGPWEDAEAVREPLAGLVNQGRLKLARDMADAARSQFPADPWLATMQAYVFLVFGDSAQAGATAAEALALGSEDPLAWLVVGVSHRNRQKHVEAAEALMKAHLGFPDRTDAACMLIEETAVAYGPERGSEVYREVFARLPDHEVTLCWARLLFGSELDDLLPAGAVSALLMSVGAWSERAGQRLDVTGEREVIQVEDPPVFGEPGAARLSASVPGYLTYATTLRGATVFSKSSIVLTADGAALNDTLADERFGRFVDIPHEKVVADRRDSRLLLDIGQFRLEELDGGIMLCGAVSEHFGHWVPEYLCRLPYLERHPRFAELPIIVDSAMPPQHLEFLKLLAPNPIVQLPAGGALRCGELIVSSPSTFFPVHLKGGHEVPPQNQGGLPTGPIRFIQQRVLQRLGPPPACDRRLYLSRKSSAWRRVKNEEEIAAALAARGFEVLYPEEMSFEDQVRMYQSARVVVAPNGSSLLNAIFAPTDLKLIVLSQRGLYNWGTFNGCMRELGYDLTFLCGEGEADEKHASYSIPLPRLLEALEALSE